VQAYRWNLTIVSELVFESIPNLILTILNFTQVQGAKADKIAYDQLRMFGKACRDFAPGDTLPPYCQVATVDASGNPTYDRVIDQVQQRMHRPRRTSLSP